MSYVVAALDGKFLAQVSLGDDPVTIGRRTTSTLVLSASNVSRDHARITRSEAGYVVKDGGGPAGIKLNGVRVPSAALTPGDEISIGDYTLRFLDGDPPERIDRSGPPVDSELDEEETARDFSLILAKPAADPSGATKPDAALEVVDFADLGFDQSLIARALDPNPEDITQSGDSWQRVAAARPNAKVAPPERGAAEEDDDESLLMNKTFMFDPRSMNLADMLLGGGKANTVATSGSDRLTALFEISKALSEAKDFNEVLVSIMDKAIAIMGAERGFLMLDESTTQELRVHVAREGGRDITGMDAETISRSLIRQVQRTGKGISMFDAQGSGTESVLLHSIQSAICVPLLTGDAVTGVLYVDRQSSLNPFTHDDVAFLTTFALQAKAAIDNSRSYWELVEGLLSASDDFLVLCSPTGAITQLNRAGGKLLGRDTAAAVGESFDDLVAENQREIARALRLETLERHVGTAVELNLLAADGRTVPMHISGFAMVAGNEPIGLCLMGRDLTEVRRLIDELTVAKADLEKHNRFIRSTFGRYLSDEIVESLLETPEGLKLGGESRRMTVLMSDLRGFTAMSESLGPEEVVSVLNNHLGTMADIVMKHQGTIDEFIGDAILAMFGAPIQRPDDAVRAAACALEMQLAMAGVNDRNRALGFPEIEMGIGLHTGEVVVGNIGSHKRAKYGIVGSNVNLTSRIEAQTVGGEVLISEATRDELGELAEIGGVRSISMKGFLEPIDLFELRGLGGKYGLSLGRDATPPEILIEPITVTFAALDDKQLRVEERAAEILELSKTEAVLSADGPLPARFENIRLQVTGPDGEILPGFAYAKVMPQAEEAFGKFLIHFTALSPEVRGFLHGLLAGG